MKTLLLTLVLLVAGQSRVAIRVSSHGVVVGSTIRVTCTVPRNPDNRMVEAALSNYWISQRPLEGSAGTITNDFLFDRVPCDVDEASCAVRTSGQRDALVQTPIVVLGCER